MIQKLGIPEAKVPELCFSLYKTYGTTMAGLKVQVIELLLYVKRHFLFVYLDLMRTNQSQSLVLSLSPGYWL